jgi:hypothetical protein
MTLFGVDAGQLALTMFVATSVTALELITSKYPRTFEFVLKSRWFYVYVLIYGLLGGISFALLPLLGDQVTTTSVIANPWIQAALVGFSIKAFLHIRIFTVSTGPGQSFPVGLESFVQLFEPWMLRSIDLDHYHEQRAFISPRAASLTDVAARTKAASNVPPGLPPQETAALNSDLNQATTSDQVIGVYLKYFGLRLTRTTFP